MTASGEISDSVGQLASNEFASRIIYEDEQILVLNKPAGMATHGDQHHASEETLIGAVRKYLQNPLSEAAFIQRLDKETSGVVIAAKNRESLAHLNRQLKFKKIQKNYWALLIGEVAPKGSIRLALQKQLDRKRWLALMVPVSRGGQHALTDYQRLNLFEFSRTKFSLVEAVPKTGRTHQLRAHFVAIGCPIAGDQLYGNFEINQMMKQHLGLQRMLLHARSIRFEHPATQQILELEAALPLDFDGIIKSLKS